jgi:CubicO group peptidase (beta-lactamase class C family)
MSALKSGCRLVVFALAASAAEAQVAPLPGPTLAAIDSVISREMANQHIPGLGLGIVHQGRLILSKGYGLANIELQVPVSEATVFKIGSVSKQFIATGVMLLVQDGKIKLDDPISRYVPNTPASWSEITVRHFLTHTSGVIREGPAFDPFKPEADSVVIASAFDKPLEFPTGTKWQYCNVCYFTLADVIRRVSGKPWPQFIRERVFEPVGMTHTRTTTTSELVPGRADGYTWQSGAQGPAAEYLALRPSGAFLSTVGDLAKWDSVLYGNSVLTAASREAMVTPMKLKSGALANPSPEAGYGFGWSIDRLDGHRRVQHGGALPGFRAQMSRYPDEGLTVIVLTNASQADPGRIESEVARVLFRAAPGSR